jgi:hypothetical protein
LLLTFWVWLTSFKMMRYGSIHLPMNDRISFFFMTELNSIVYKYHIFLIRFLVVRHLGFFHSLAIVNSAVIDMGVQVWHFFLKRQNWHWIPWRKRYGWLVGKEWEGRHSREKEDIEKNRDMGKVQGRGTGNSESQFV